MSDTKLSGYEATEAALGEWTRDESPDWSPLPPLMSAGLVKPAHWNHKTWGDES